MNEQIKQLALQCGAWHQVYDNKRFMLDSNFDVEKFSELIVRECITVVDRDDGATHVQELLLKHFELEEQSIEPSELHTCPYAEEIHNDYETLCDCDEEQTYQCAMDV